MLRNNFMRIEGRPKLLWNVFKISLISAALGVSAFATSIPVPNGDFSQASNNGSIGGGLLNPSGSAVIGSGPWSGTYNGVLGVLAPPRLTIGNGVARIAGVAGINVLGVVNNGGYFSENLSGVTYQPDTTYTLSAEVDAGTLLGLNLLSNSGVGIALTNGGNVTSSSTTAPTNLLSLTLLSGTNYELSLTYVTGATAPSGPLGIRLFDTPQGLLTANLLAGVTFDNVTLDATSNVTPTPEPSSFLLGAFGLAVACFVMKCRRAANNA